jgi:hypothetical protein
VVTGSKGSVNGKHEKIIESKETKGGESCPSVKKSIGILAICVVVSGTIVGIQSLN